MLPTHPVLPFAPLVVPAKPLRPRQRVAAAKAQAPLARASGRLYKLAAGAMGLDRLVEPALDLTRMSATAVISTPTPDRGADVLLPEGMRSENYRKNPVVLWEHGLSGIDFPIAKCEDPDGRLALTICPEGVTATAYFTSSIPESEQIFALIAERIIRAASVRAMILKSHPRRGSSGEIGLVVDEWDLEEWSWVAVPANPDAVAQVLERGRVCGRSLAEPLQKSLAALLPERGMHGVGWREADQALNEHEHESHRDDLDDVPKGPEAPKPEDHVDEPVEQDTEDGHLDRATDELKSDERDFGDLLRSKPPSIAPRGARVLGRVHERLLRLAIDIEAARQPIEQPNVREHLQTLAQTLRSCDEACQVCRQDCYPQLELVSSAHDESSQAIAERLSQQLRSRPERQSGWRRLPGRLVRLARSGRIGPREARWLRGMAVKLAALIDDASAAPATVPRSEALDNTRPLPRSLVERLDVLETRARALADLLPAPRRRAA